MCVQNYIVSVEQWSFWSTTGIFFATANILKIWQEKIGPGSPATNANVAGYTIEVLATTLIAATSAGIDVTLRSSINAANITKEGFLTPLRNLTIQWVYSSDIFSLFIYIWSRLFHCLGRTSQNSTLVRKQGYFQALKFLLPQLVLQAISPQSWGSLFGAYYLCGMFRCS